MARQMAAIQRILLRPGVETSWPVTVGDAEELDRSTSAQIHKIEDM